MPHDCPPYTAARQRLRTSSRALHGQAVERRCRRRRGVVPSPFAQGLGCAHPSVTTGSARCRHATGSSAASTAQPRARPVTVGAAASCGADVQLVSNWQWLRPRRRLVLRRPNQSARCTFWLECRSRQMAVFCAVSANNCSHGAPISLPTSTSTHPRLLRARGRCLGPSTRPYAPQTRLLDQ